MISVTLSATVQGNGYQATVTFPDGISISSAETYPTVSLAISAAATKLLDMPELGHATNSDLPKSPRHT